MADLGLVEKMRLNRVHIWPSLERKEEAWLAPVSLLKEREGSWKEELERLHGMGVEVIASMSSVGFYPELLSRVGREPERYFALDGKGNPRGMLGAAPKAGNPYASCYNNPDWIGHLQETAEWFACMRFDGCWCDVGGYFDSAVFCCRCGHCQRKWRAHLARRGLAEDTPLPGPRDAMDMGKPLSREHLTWRLACWAEWQKRIRDRVRATHPGFTFGHNLSVDIRSGFAPGLVAYLYGCKLYDFLDLEDGGHGAAPYSTLPSYLLGRCLAPGLPVFMVWQPQAMKDPALPIESEVQHRILLWEGYAAGGVCQNWVGFPEVNAEVNTFVAEHEEIYRVRDSLANVAVVFSSATQFFHAKHGMRGAITFWTGDGIHPGRFFGQMLLDLHVPFDYLLAERDLTPGRLQRYQTVILPDLACLGDAQLEVLGDYLRRGGNVVATGDTGRFDEALNERAIPGLEALAGRAVEGDSRLEVGKGKLVRFSGLPECEHAKRNARDLVAHEMLAPPVPPPREVWEALTWCWEGCLPVEVAASIPTAVVPWQDLHSLVFHLVNGNAYPDGQALTPDKDIELRVRLPWGKGVERAEFVSPDLPEARPLEVRLEKGRVVLRLDELRCYGVVCVTLCDQ
jgi:hypothetical protein